MLCDSLNLRAGNSVDSEAVQSLAYGSRLIVLNQTDGWAECALGDSESSPSGWVNADFIAIDPAWYRTTEATPVYAWSEEAAPKVAVLDADTVLPILKDEEEWIIVSLRGATGWIHNPDRTVSQNLDVAAAETPQDQNKTESKTESTAASEEKQGSWFTVYAKSGSTASIHLVAGATYEDEKGRTYVKDSEDAFYYCVSTDTTYAADPTQWTGEYYGENQFPDEDEDTGSNSEDNSNWNGEEYGENQFPEDEDELTGSDYGAGWNGEEYGENQFPDEVDE